MVPPMPEAEFWKLIDDARPKLLYSQDKHLAALRKSLARLTPESIVAFNERRGELLARSYDWKLWAAAYVIGGGCGDDGFDYFRSWIISQGRAFFERTVEDPDSLAQDKRVGIWLDDLPEFELFDYAAHEAYEAVTGTEMPPGTIHHREEPTGEQWDEEDDESLRRLVPRLMALRGA